MNGDKQGLPWFSFSRCIRAFIRAAAAAAAAAIVHRDQLLPALAPAPAAPFLNQSKQIREDDAPL